MSNISPFFSIIIPTFNRLPFLKIAVESVLQQTYEHWELIVIDDGSSDGTKEWVDTIDDKRVQYLWQENHGVSYARNRGLEKAKGDFIAFLDSDDKYVPQKLQRAVDMIQEHSDVKIFHTDEVWYRKGELLNQKKKHQKPHGHVYPQALPLCCISISTVVVHKDVFDDVGVFDESLEACEDYDFWLRTTYKYPVHHLAEDLTVKDGGRSDQLSMSVWGLDRFRIRALEKMLRSGVLDENNRQITYAELKKKCDIFCAGAKKRGKEEEASQYQKLVNELSTN